MSFNSGRLYGGQREITPYRVIPSREERLHKLRLVVDGAVGDSVPRLRSWFKKEYSEATTKERKELLVAASRALDNLLAELKTFICEENDNPGSEWNRAHSDRIFYRAKELESTFKEAGCDLRKSDSPEADCARLLERVTHRLGHFLSEGID